MSEVPQGVGQRPWPGRPHSCSSSVSVYLGDGPLIPPPTPSSPKPEISARADPLSSERDTQASQGQIKARFWPWLSGRSPPKPSRLSTLRSAVGPRTGIWESGAAASESGTNKPVRSEIRTWLWRFPGERDLWCSLFFFFFITLEHRVE